jgi:hypothetical protein
MLTWRFLKQEASMRIKSKIKAGGINMQHNQSAPEVR